MCIPLSLSPIIFFIFSLSPLPFQSTPPLYNLSQYPVPTYLFTGGQDWLADPTDVKGLINKLNTTSDALKGVTNIPYYEHLDFIWGIDAAEKVYKVLINYINGSN